MAIAVNSPTGMCLSPMNTNKLLPSSNTPRTRWYLGCAVRQMPCDHWRRVKPVVVRAWKP